MLGRAELDTLLAERDELNDSLRRIIDEQTEPWGIKVTTVEIKDVEIPEAMQRAMARQAEAERERRAKIIAAEGEFQASQKLFEAAEILSRNPAAMQLRYLQTLVELGGEKSTVVFPLPLDLIAPFLTGTQNERETRTEGPLPTTKRTRRPPDGFLDIEAAVQWPRGSGWYSQGQFFGWFRSVLPMSRGL